MENLVFNWPQILFIVAWVISLIVYALKDGEKKDEKYNFNLKLVSIGFTVFVLYQGGFFT